MFSQNCMTLFSLWKAKGDVMKAVSDLQSQSLFTYAVWEKNHEGQKKPTTAIIMTVLIVARIAVEKVDI